METVEDRLSRAQAAGDLGEIRAALADAQRAGADAAQIQVALAEVDRLAAEGGAEAAAAPTRATARERRESPAAEDAAAAAEAAEEAASLRSRAEAHKKSGNERLKDSTKSAAREALECFTAGIQVSCADAVLNAQLHSNRAHVRILLRQFVEAVDDCRKAIDLDPKNLKAYWRAAKASLNLDLCRNGIEFCEAGLRQEPKDADLTRIRDTCAEKLAGQQQRKAAEKSVAAGAPEFNQGLADEAMAVQERVNDLQEQINALKMTLGQKQRDRMRSKLTQNSLADTPADVRVFSPMGRSFMAQGRAEVEESLTSTIETLEVELPKLTNALEELERRKAAAESEFKEMMKGFMQSQGVSPPAGS